MKTKIIVGAIFLVIAYAAFANPNGTGQPVMSALVGIQDAIMALGGEPEQAEKEWYQGHFKIEPSQNDALFIVPAGRQFVLTRLYVYPYGDKGSTLWHLAANETTILNGSIIKYSYTTNQGGMTYKYEHDFPDGCITVDANEVLNTVNEDVGSLDITTIGYFRDMP